MHIINLLHFTQGCVYNIGVNKNDKHSHISPALSFGPFLSLFVLSSLSIIFFSDFDSVQQIKLATRTSLLGALIVFVGLCVIEICEQTHRYVAMMIV